MTARAPLDVLAIVHDFQLRRLLGLVGLPVFALHRFQLRDSRNCLEALSEIADGRVVDPQRDCDLAVGTVGMVRKFRTSLRTGRSAQLGNVPNKLERRAGEMLAATEKAKGAREKGVGKAGRNAVSDRDRVKPPTLKDLGITKTQSSKWQGLAPP